MSREIENVNFHMNLLNCDVDDLKIKIPHLKGKSEIQIADGFGVGSELTSLYEDFLEGNARK